MASDSNVEDQQKKAEKLKIKENKNLGARRETITPCTSLLFNSFSLHFSLFSVIFCSGRIQFIPWFLRDIHTLVVC